MHQSLRKSLRKYFVMGSQNCQTDPVATLELAAKAGITSFQYREKEKGALIGKEKLELGKELRKICKEHDILFIVNDDIDLVEPLDADGIHVGQDDISVQKIRELFPNKMIGLSVSNVREVDQSPIQLVDYLGAGPIFGTTTKQDAKQPVGVDWIQSLRAQFPNMPLVGIGGINTENAHSVIEAGADGVAVISAITNAQNIQGAVEQL
ncbi:thiamine phosphate synthase [Ornithinibacillus sp. L9]|uniref:Thiamine-phosphate synthase n=1 Tax=Ornithinibacillus caprae TaxID=2678566 RepID=A0A6N8FNP1_9BACI|nr:thiamine phosphate synthase [Ornithinibacillus caprae]MUK89409.1 thiamine phosphate synthase [Ornithinibacillus caprae]